MFLTSKAHRRRSLTNLIKIKPNDAFASSYRRVRLMRRKLFGVLIAVFAVLVPAAPAFAHHGFSVEFDKDKCMDLQGTLSGIDWENPHAYFDMDVKQATGKAVTWHLEMITPNALKRNGTTRQDFLGNMGK